MVATKTCTTCGTCKPADEFHKHANVIGGRRGQCKACTNASTAAWRAANIDKHRATRTAYHVQRYASDPLFALHHKMRSLISSSLRVQGHVKRDRTIAVLGCDMEGLKAHIERQFVRGMSWKNRAKWHIDHIVPISSAATEAEVIALNHFTNLRPVWRRVNLAKSNAVTHLI